MADKTDDADAKPKGSFQDQIRDAVQNAPDAPGKAAEDDQDDDGKLNTADKGGANAEADDLNNDDDGSGDDDAGNGDDDDDAANADDDGKSDVKLPQFKGDGKRGSYTKNIEGAYIEQATQLNDANDRAETFERQVTAIREAANKDPEFGKQLLKLLDVDGNGGSGGDADRGAGGGQSADVAEDPFLTNAKTEWKAKNELNTKEFVDNNPEVMTDPKLNKEVKELMRHFSQMELQKSGRLMMGGEAMEKAYAYLGRDVKTKANQDLVDGLKGDAAPVRPNRPKKSAKGNPKQFSDLTLKMAGNMGISKERLLKGTGKS